MTTGQSPSGASPAGQDRVTWHLRGQPGFDPRRPALEPCQLRRTGSGPDRLSPHRDRSQRSSIHRDESRCIAANRAGLRRVAVHTGGHYPDPHGSNTFCRRLVGLPAGEAGMPGRFRATPEPTGDMGAPLDESSGASISRSGPAFAKPAAEHAACAGHPASRAAPRFPPRRGLRLAAPKVSFIVGSTSEGLVPDPASRDRSVTTRGVDCCPQVVPILWRKSPRLCDLVATLLGQSRAAQRLGHRKRSAREPIRLRSVRSVP